MRRIATALVGLAVVAVALLAGPAPASAQSPRQGEATRLEQNVPNPFTPGFSQTIVAYRLDRRARVRVSVMNTLAQEVAVLVDRVEDPGRYVVSWDGIGANGEYVPQGIYWYDLALDGQRVAVRQMRVLESGDSADDETGRGEPAAAPLAASVSESGRAAARSSRTWWGLLR